MRSNARARAFLSPQQRTGRRYQVTTAGKNLQFTHFFSPCDYAGKKFKTNSLFKQLVYLFRLNSSVS